MIRPRRAPATDPKSGRVERPANLHPLLVETHNVWLQSRMTATEASNRVGISKSTIYGWFMGRGRPMFTPLDGMMLLVGHRYTITAGARPGIEPLESTNAAGLRRNDDPIEGLHPVLAEADELWRKSGIAIEHAATALCMTGGPIYRWFSGKADPGLLELDTLLGFAGHRLTIVRGIRPRLTPRVAPK